MPPLAWRLLHVLALCSLAITQPLLGILGDNATFFTAHDSTPAQVVWLSVLIALGPALLLGAVAVVAHWADRTWGERIHLAILSLLGFLLVIQVIDALPGPWPLATLVGIAITAGLIFLYATKPPFRSVVSMLALTPLVFVGLFLFISPASEIVFPAAVDAVNLDDLLADGGIESGRIDDTDDEPPLTLAEQVAQRFPPIFVLVFDELPMASLLDENGEIDRARWPNFARLADTSHLFSNATTIGFTTERAVPAILTGRYETEAAPVYSLYPENLFTLLGDIYDVSSSDPLVDLCPPSVCDGNPPRAILDLLASDETAPTMPSTTSSTTPPSAAEPDAETEAGGSFRLLLDDALIVFGHLATPDGLDVGLPSIGSTWGDFGGDPGSHPQGGDEPTPNTTTSTTSTTSTTTTTTTLAVDIGQVPIDNVTEVDSDAVNQENADFLDSLITDDSRVADFRAEVARITTTDTPQLQFMHTLLPHVPWRLHPDGETYADIELPGYFAMWDDDVATARAGQQRHLLQLQFTDRLLGEYLDQLEQQSIFEDAIVVVTADHGISFVPGSRSRGVDVDNIGGIAGVPLFYKLPGQTEAVRHHNPVETIDIVPTIAASLDVDVPWSIDGVDLLGAEVERNRAVLHPFTAEIPVPYQPWMDEVTDQLLATFGNGTTGNLYGLAGLHESIGASISSLTDDPASYCWVRDRPDTLPEDGSTGFIYGRLATARTDRISLAITVGDTLTGTSVSLGPGTTHRVYGFGDPEYWIDATPADIGLHEIVDGRLHPIPTC